MPHKFQTMTRKTQTKVRTRFCNMKIVVVHKCIFLLD